MNPLIVGSNLTDLGRNSLAAAQQEQDASQATSNRLLQYLMEQNRNRQAQGDLSYRNRALDADSSYRNNALAQQMQMWNTPSATAQLPFNSQTADAKARDAILQHQYDIENATKQKIIDAQINSPYGFLDPATRDKLIMDKYNSAKQEQDAADMMNALTQAKIADVAQPVLKDRLDYGSDNNNNWTFGMGGLTGPHATEAADAIVGKTPPPTWTFGDSFEKDAAAKGTKNWFANNRNQFIEPAMQKAISEHPEAVQFTKWDPVIMKWVAKSQPLTPVPQPAPGADGKAVPGLALFQGGATTNAPSTNAFVAQVPPPLRIGNFTVTPIR